MKMAITDQLPAQSFDGRFQRNDLLDWIDQVIERYEVLCSSADQRDVPRRVKRELTNLRKPLATLTTRLNAIYEPAKMQLIEAVLTPSHISSSGYTVPIPKRRGSTHLAIALTELNKLACWIDTAACTPSANEETHLVWLVSELGKLFEQYTGKPFNRGQKGPYHALDFVETILRGKLPRLELAPSTVENLVRSACKLRAAACKN
jgi:hypothetical protein